ncbi:MAG: hypothetical protein GY737_09985 [Desulfobacteraceae bacterium]|nr:hypothetical protein [Desulfobacteraceae bacterium]
MKSYRPVAFGKRAAFAITLLICVTILLASCGKRPAPDGISSASASAWPQTYDDAIADALNPEPGEVAHNLIAITRDNPDLQWKEINGIPHVLMVSLTGNTDYYKNNVGKPYNTGNYYSWVTASPEMKHICGSLDLTDDELKMRLRELLGLVPDAGVLAFVEFWVKPSDMFRPAPDNEIDDTTAGLILPDNTPPWYRKWFNELRSKQYYQCTATGHNAYPWTQLGYTYDWGNPESEQGLSEFVIKENSQVVIRAIHPFANYCQ